RRQMSEMDQTQDRGAARDQHGPLLHGERHKSGRLVERAEGAVDHRLPFPRGLRLDGPFRVFEAGGAFVGCLGGGWAAPAERVEARGGALASRRAPLVTFRPGCAVLSPAFAARIGLPLVGARVGCARETGRAVGEAAPDARVGALPATIASPPFSGAMRAGVRPVALADPLRAPADRTPRCAEALAAHDEPEVIAARASRGAPARIARARVSRSRTPPLRLAAPPAAAAATPP